MAAVMLTAYRRGEKLFHVDSFDCLAAVATKDDMDLVEIAIAHHRPVLIGLNGHNTIVKTVAEDDETHSFEDLYDTAFTIADLANMQRQQVDSPDQIKPDTYRLAVAFDLHLSVPIAIALRANTNAGCHPRLRQLMQSDPMFREAIRHAVISWLDENFEFAGQINYLPEDAVRIEPELLALDSNWRILDGD